MVCFLSIIFDLDLIIVRSRNFSLSDFRHSTLHLVLVYVYFGNSLLKGI